MAANSLAELLDVRPSFKGSNTYVAAASPENHVRAFGGRTFAQTLMATSHTVAPEVSVHSCHAYFLRPGSSSESMECQVQNLRDGRSFSSRRATAIQGSKAVLELMASFHLGETGPKHQDDMPRVPLPTSLQPFEERFAGRNKEGDMERWFFRTSPFDVRYVSTSPFEDPNAERQPTQQVWFRAKDLPNSPLMHQAALAYASDLTILDPVLLRHGMKWTDRAILGATLDHSMWFHHQVDFSEWILFDQHSSVGNNGRALATANCWTENGVLVATVSQEALMRPL